MTASQIQPAQPMPLTHATDYTQEQIDLMNNAILKNTLAAATPRWFVRNDGAINEEEYLDLTKPRLLPMVPAV